MTDEERKALEEKALELYGKVDAWFADGRNEEAAAGILTRAEILYGGNEQLETAYVVREVLSRVGVSLTLEEAASCLKPPRPRGSIES